MNCIFILIGFYFVTLSFILNTQNVKSAIVFKVIPFFSGIFLIFYFFYITGVIKIN